MTKIKKIDFRPFPGIFSPHFQMIFARYAPSGKAPASETFRVQLDGKDQLSCEMTPPGVSNKNNLTTIVMIHGLGGSHESGYLVRLARKFSGEGYRVVRVNLRNCGSGKGLSSLPYNAGTSPDLLAVLKSLKEQYPQSRFILIGFSLGGNVAIKLAGELKAQASKFFDALIAVCPPIDLYDAVARIMLKSNWIYHQFYLKYFLEQSKPWLTDKPVKSLYEFDDKITAALWGYSDAKDYYAKSSSIHFLDKVTVPCRLLFAADDPFIDYRLLEKVPTADSVDVWLTQKGGHMGFIGFAGREHGLYWMDCVLLAWVRELQKQLKILHEW